MTTRRGGGRARGRVRTPPARAGEVVERGAEAEDTLVLRPIGVIRTPFREMEGTPIQPVYGTGIEAEVVLHPQYERALDDIAGFERLWLLYWLDRAGPFTAKLVPYRDTCERGALATRAPCRPNPLGMSVVRLIERRGCVLRVVDVDVLHGTPLLDVKPYVPAFDAFPAARAGWLDETGSGRSAADQRFGAGAARSAEAERRRRES